MQLCVEDDSLASPLSQPWHCARMEALFDYDSDAVQMLLIVSHDERSDEEVSNLLSPH